MNLRSHLPLCWAVLATTAGAIAGCSGTPSVGCETNGDCEGEQICTEGVCTTPCNVTADCADGEFCNGGTCASLSTQPCVDTLDCLRPGTCEILAGVRCEDDICVYGFDLTCCDSGNCCNADADCLAIRETPSACGDLSPASDCQGSATEARCLENQCAAVVVDDDGGCAGILHACGDNLAAVACTNQVDQSVPICASSCETDPECAPGYECDTQACVLPAGVGEACNDSGDCSGGLECQSSVCCDTGTGPCCTVDADCALGLRCDTASFKCHTTCNDGDTSLCVDPVTMICTDNTCAPTVLVTPVYPASSNWNDYVRNDDPAQDIYHQPGTPCAPDDTGYDACLHAGELRTFEAPGVSSCAGLAATDALGVFEWACDDAGGAGPVAFFSAGFQPGRGLGHLLDASGFFDNFVTVTGDAGTETVATSMPAVWDWANEVQQAPDNSTTAAVELGGVGRIHVVATSRDTYGYNLSATGSALVVLPGAALNAAPDFVSNTNGSGNLGGTTRCLVAAGDEAFIWIEGELESRAPAPMSSRILVHDTSHARLQRVSITDGDEDGIELGGTSHNITLNDISIDTTQDFGLFVAGADYNVVTNLEVTNAGTEGVDVDGVRVDADADFNRFYEITTHHNPGRGFRSASSEATEIDGITTWANGGDGVELQGRQNHRLTNVRQWDSGNVRLAWAGQTHVSHLWIADGGLSLHETDDGTFYDLHIHNPESEGISVGTDSKRNRFVDVFIHNNDGYGIRVWSGSGLPALGNTFVRVLVAGGGQDGIYVQNDSVQNTFRDLTVANALWAGVTFAAREQEMVNVVVVNNGDPATGHNGVNANNLADSCHYLAIATAHNQDWGFHDRGTGSELHGDLLVGNNGLGMCGIANGTSLIDVTCSDTGLDGSTTPGGALLHTDINLQNSFVGQIFTDDAANTSDSAGTGVFDEIADWLDFESAYRGWGSYGPAFPAGENRGDCTTGTCQIWDWRLRSSDAELLGFHGDFDPGNCPASAHGDQSTTDHQSPPNTFLNHAFEIMADAVGDDDGLCESAEACVFAPNLGAYQGEGALIGPCTFEAGAITGVSLFGHSTNGQ